MPAGQAYLRLVQFNGGASDEFALAAQQYKEDGLQKLLLDLRNNGGGSLSVLRGIAAYLLKDADKGSQLMYAGEEGDRAVYSLKDYLYADYFASSKIYAAGNSNTASASFRTARLLLLLSGGLLSLRFAGRLRQTVAAGKTLIETRPARYRRFPCRAAEQPSRSPRPCRTLGKMRNPIFNRTTNHSHHGTIQKQP